jgi:mono/diheme cytochrome c family protein
VSQATCSTCHQPDGQGLSDVFPPLAGSDYLMADRDRSIRVVLDGLSGPIVVNGRSFATTMPPLAHLTDHEIADVLTYVRNSFGNGGEAVRDEEVARVRERLREPRKEGHP